MPAFIEDIEINIIDKDEINDTEIEYDGGVFGIVNYKNYAINWLEIVTSVLFITYVSLVLLTTMSGIWKTPNVFNKVNSYIDKWVAAGSFLLSVCGSMAMRRKEISYSIRNIKTNPSVVFVGLMLVAMLVLSRRFVLSTIQSLPCQPKEIDTGGLGKTSGLVLSYIFYVCVKAIFNGDLSYTSNLVRSISIGVGALIMLATVILNMMSKIDNRNVSYGYAAAGIAMAFINMFTFDLRTMTKPKNMLNWIITITAIVLFISSLIIIKNAYCLNQQNAWEFI